MSQHVFGLVKQSLFQKKVYKTLTRDFERNISFQSRIKIPVPT